MAARAVRGGVRTCAHSNNNVMMNIEVMTVLSDNSCFGRCLHCIIHRIYIGE